MSNVYNYARITNVATNSSYPYSAVQKLCIRKPSQAGPYRVNTFAVTASNDCNAMFNRVTLAPVSVGVGVANSATFMSYRSGIITLNQCPVNAANANYVDHAVLIVGYDANKNWKIQNSWGTTWGIQGYAWLAFGNTCNICRYGGYYSTLV